MMTEEEKAEVETQLNGGQKPASSVNVPPATPLLIIPKHPLRLLLSRHLNLHRLRRLRLKYIRAPSSHTLMIGRTRRQLRCLPAPKRTPERRKRKPLHGRKRIAAEHREKWREQEKERRKAMEERVTSLTTKLIERLRPFVEAKNPGDKDDPETQAFEAKFKREAEDLKLESFGVELLHTIGMVYMMKATSFLKSKKFLGMCVTVRFSCNLFRVLNV